MLSAALLVAAEFMANSKIVVGSLQTVERTTSGHDSHSYALALIAILALPMALGARRARPPSATSVAAGAVALLVAFTVDYPDTHGHGELADTLSFQDAQAKPGPGFRVELAGAALLVLSGAGLLALGPRRRVRRPDNRRRFVSGEPPADG